MATPFIKCLERARRCAGFSREFSLILITISRGRWIRCYHRTEDRDLEVEGFAQVPRAKTQTQVCLTLSYLAQQSFCPCWLRGALAGGPDPENLENPVGWGRDGNCLIQQGCPALSSSNLWLKMPSLPAPTLHQPATGTGPPGSLLVRISTEREREREREHEPAITPSYPLFCFQNLNGSQLVGTSPPRESSRSGARNLEHVVFQSPGGREDSFQPGPG